MYECLVGYTPFYADDPVMTCRKILRWQQVGALGSRAQCLLEREGRERKHFACSSMAKKKRGVRRTKQKMPRVVVVWRPRTLPGMELACARAREVLCCTDGNVVLVPSVADLVPVARALFIDARLHSHRRRAKHLQYCIHQLVVARARAVYCSV